MPALITTADAVESIKAAALSKNIEWYNGMVQRCVFNREGIQGTYPLLKRIHEGFHKEG